MAASKRESTHKLRVKIVEEKQKYRLFDNVQLAIEVGVDVSSIKRWLAGGNVRRSHILDLATVLGTTPQEIAYGFEPPISTQLAQSKKTIFQTNITIEGEIENPHQLGLLVNLTPDVVATLTRMGIKISAFQSTQRLRSMLVTV